VIILCGRNGLGQDHPDPQALLLRAGLGVHRPIVVTQPRRVAAMSLARRVAEEMQVMETAFVGHRVRFDNRVKSETRVVFATDGALLAELGSDPDLRRYEAIVVDEAHERSLNVDFLLGVLQRIRMPNDPNCAS
jgi:ATP-dependent helicase HrpA